MISGPLCPSETLILVVLGKILKAVEPGTVWDPIAAPTKFTLAPVVLLPPALTSLSSSVLMVPIHMVLEPTLASW